MLSGKNQLLRSCSLPELTSALAVGIGVCALLLVPILAVGYGFERLGGVLVASGLMVLLLAAPIAPMTVVYALRTSLNAGPSRATFVEVAVWIVGSAVTWWFAPLFLTGPPSVYGLATGLGPVAVTTAATGWVIMRRAARQTSQPT